MIEKTKVRNQLFSTLKQAGLQQQLKIQLRVQIVQKLKQKNVLSLNNQKEYKESKLYHRVLSSLISQELKYSDCGYAQSIYVLQAGFQDNMLSRNQLIQILNIGNCQLDSKISLLSNIMKRQYPFNMSTVQNSCVQTNPQQIGYTVQQRLLFIDQQFRRNLIKQNSQAQKYVNLKLQKLQQIQLNLKKQYQRDLQRIKVQVGQQWRKKYQEHSKNIETQYQRKIDQVRKRQRLLEQDYVKKNKNLQQKSGAIQANLKQKIELLDLKSATIQKQLQNMSQTTKNAQKEIRNQQVQLRQKIRKYDDLLLELNKKIQYQTNIVRLSIQQEYQQKQMQFIQRKKFVDDQYGKLMSIKTTCQVIERDNTRVHSQNKQLRQRIGILQKDFHNSVNDLAAKGQRIDLLKQEIFQQRQKCIKINQNLKQHQKKVKNLQKELLSMRKQIQQLRKINQKYEQQKIIKQNQIQNKSESQQVDHKKNKFSDIAAKVDMLKNQRKKDIQKFMLQ